MKNASKKKKIGRMVKKCCLSRWIWFILFFQDHVKSTIITRKKWFLWAWWWNNYVKTVWGALKSQKLLSNQQHFVRWLLENVFKNCGKKMWQRTSFLNAPKAFTLNRMLLEKHITTQTNSIKIIRNELKQLFTFVADSFIPTPCAHSGYMQRENRITRAQIA